RGKRERVRAVDQLVECSNCLELDAEPRVLTVGREWQPKVLERCNWISYVQKLVQNQYRYHGYKTRRRKCHEKCPICHLKSSCRLGTLKNGRSNDKRCEQLSLSLLHSHMKQRSILSIHARCEDWK